MVEEEMVDKVCARACVCVFVRASVRVCVRVCVCVPSTRFSILCSLFPSDVHSSGHLLRIQL